MYISFFNLSFMILYSTLFAQSNISNNSKMPCGTVHGLSDEEYQNKLIQYSNIADEFNNQNRDTEFIRVQFHIVRQDNGAGGLYEPNLWPVLQQVNEDYEEAGLFFYHPSEVNEIYSNEYYNCEDDAELNQLRNLYDTPSVMDIFVVASATSGGTALCGISTFTFMSVQGIVVTISCWDPETVSHEIGHYFDLYHTHEQQPEYVDGSYCQYRGDGLCDTPADPNLSLSGMVNGACEYVGDAVDGHGQAYDDCQGYPPCETYGGPDSKNIMSYNLLPGCVDNLTVDQLNKASSVANIYRSDYFLTPEFPYFEFNEYSFYEDSGGDNDNVINPGETVGLTFNLSIPEYWPAAGENILAIISSDNPFLNINTEEILIGSMQPGESFVNSENPIILTFDEDAPLGSYDVNIWIIAGNNQEFTASLNLSVNQFGFPVFSQQIKTSHLAIDINNDGTEEIIWGDYTGYVNIINNDGSEYESENFPFNTGDQIWGSPSAADIDNDGFIDFIVASKSNKIFIFDKDGIKSDFDLGQILLGTPVIGNLDDDSDLEIVIGSYSNPSSSNNLYVLNHDGTMVSGFPIAIGEKMKAGVALADFNNNGKDDIVLGTDDDNIYLIYDDATIDSNFPFITEDKIQASPTVLDISGEKIILSGSTDNNFYAIKSDGTLKFKIETGNKILSSSAFVNYNNLLYIIFTSTDQHLYIIDQSGNHHWGSPLNLDVTPSGSPIVADLDNDENPEIIFTSENGEIHGIHLESAENFSFLPVANDFPFSSTPQVLNLDNDSDLEIIAGSVSNIAAIDLNGIESEEFSSNYWKEYQGGTTRSGYFESEILSISDFDIPIEFKLHPAYPNPFNPVTSIFYTAPKSLYTTIIVYNILGQEVEILLNQNLDVGKFTFNWDASKYPSGTYLINIKNSEFNQIQKVLLIK